MNNKLQNIVFGMKKKKYDFLDARKDFFDLDFDDFKLAIDDLHVIVFM